MPKTSKKKTPKKPTAARKPAKKSAAGAQAKSQTPLVTTQPVSKTQAALSSGMFLFTNDSWATRYFDPSDLHNTERMVFA